MATRRASNWEGGLQNGIQASLLVLVGLMPFHAFLSVWLGQLFGHEAVIEAWKEALLIVLALLTAILVWRRSHLLQRLKQPWVILAGAFSLVAMIITIAAHPPLTATAFGLKTDLEFLVAATIALLVATPVFVRRLVVVILAGSAVVIGFGLLQIFVLPPDFLTHFGYGPNTILPYEQIASHALRYPSTLGGPNQLGTYLILPLSFSLALSLRRRIWWPLLLTVSGLLVLIGTYSRGAWIGAVAALAFTLLAGAPTRWRRPLLLAFGILGLGLLIGLPVVVSHNQKLRNYVYHQSLTAGTPSSDSQHASSLQAGLHGVLSRPLGHGLGTAGPATFHSGAVNIIEDYYLQTGYETGIPGLLLFVSCVLAILLALRARAGWFAAMPAAAAVIGISLVALVLPSWTDSSTALITWTTAGAICGLPTGRTHV
jgi:putative inorganic carbon (HCO3(-)) transporter